MDRRRCISEQNVLEYTMYPLLYICKSVLIASRGLLSIEQTAEDTNSNAKWYLSWAQVNNKTDSLQTALKWGNYIIINFRP